MLVTLGGVSGCEFFQDTVEARARVFLETLIREPENEDKLKLIIASGEEADPKSIIADLSTKHAINYLRARHRQEMKLVLAVIVTQHIDASHREVLVAVSADRPGMHYEDDNRIRLLVSLQSSDERGWLVTGVRVE